MESKTLSDLYKKLSAQGENIVLDKDAMGSAMVDQWTELLHRDSFQLSSVALSTPDETGNFTVSGSSELMKFGKVTLDFDFFVAFSDSDAQIETLQCVIRPASTFNTWNLTNDFPDMPGYVDYSAVEQGLQTSFLTLIEFKDLSFRFSSFDFSLNGSTGKSTSYKGEAAIDGEKLKEGINFGATIDTNGDFWKTVKQITGELGKMQLFAHIMDDRGALSFEAGANLNYVFKISDGLSVTLKKLMISSGLNNNSLQSPTFSLMSEIAAIQPPLELEIDLDIGRSWIHFFGFFEEGRVLTLTDIASKLGMKGLEIDKLLPTGSTVESFGQFGLKDFNLEMELSPVNVKELAFTISTSKPWVIINNQVRIQAWLRVSVTNPFDTAQRKAQLEILGIWKLGQTDFYLYALPLSGEVSAIMEEGKTLDVGALTKLLLPGITLPSIELEKMSFIANFLSNTYYVQLAAKTGLSFDLGFCKLGISEVGFSCFYNGNKLQDLNIGGTLCLGGLIFDVEGDYKDTDKCELHGGIRSDTKINFGDFYNSLVSDLGIPEAKLPATIPPQYLSVEIGGMFVDYKSKDNDFIAYVDLINPFQISEKFKIDEIAIRLHFTSKGLADAVVKMQLSVLSVNIILELDYDQAKKEWKFIGGTKQDQKIQIGELATDLLNKFGCSVEIPDMIQGLVVKNIQVIFNTSTEGQEFSFSCQGSMPIEGKELDLSVGLNFSRKDRKYTFDITGQLHIDPLTFTIEFEHKNTQNILAAIAKENPPLTIALHDVISKLSDEAGQLIPKSLEISLKDAFFILAKETKGENAGGFNILFGIDIGSQIDISTLPVIGSLFDAGTKIGFDDLQAVVSTKPVSDTLYASIQEVLQKSKTKLQPDSLPDTGLYISAIFNLGEIKPKLTLPILKKAPKSVNATLPVLLGAPDDSEGLQKIHWNDINKTIGPIELRRVGVGLQTKTANSELTFAVDISVVKSGFELDLIGLWIGINVNKPFASIPDFGLHGVNVAFSQPPIEFNGGLLYVNPAGHGYTWEINGQLIIKYGEYGLFGVGSYAQPDTENWPFKNVPVLPSFFAFLMVSAPIGGPPYLYLSGLAGGFGFNRSLKVPQASELLSFPLVQGALGSGDLKAGMNADAALTAMNTWVPPKPNDFWLAIGMAVGSCHILDAFVMVTAVFGADFELAVIGLATADIPTKESSELLAHLELALVGNFNPMHGAIEITGALTSTSYLFVPQCKLTGGFAYCIWMEKGNFLVSIGGYSPAFKKPDYYPVLQHVGINCKLSEYLVLQGGAYYAFTPSCAMAGGELNLDFHFSAIHAWLTAHADFLLEWLPFHYDIGIGVSIGVAIKIDFWFVHKTIKLEVGADIHMWGPSFAGEAKVHLWIVSFTIGFGENANKIPPRLSWDQFYDVLLAGGDKKTINTLRAESGNASINAITVKEGLLSGVRQPGKEDYWIVNPDKFVFETSSAVPSNHLTFNGNDVPLSNHNTQFGVRPMGQTSMDSKHQVWFERQLMNGTWVPLAGDQIGYDISTGNLPEANWADTPLTRPGAGTVDNVPVGMIFALKPQTYYVLPPTGEVDTSIFMFEASSLIFAWGAKQAPKNPVCTDPPMIKLKETLMSDTVKAKRSKLLDELNGNNFNLLTKINLDVFADSAENILQSAPQIFELGAVEE